MSLVLQLEELGCVTLMPVTHLLPSQLSQLCSEAGLSAARFPTGSLRAGGRVGERATAGLQVQSVVAAVRVVRLCVYQHACMQQVWCPWGSACSGVCEAHTQQQQQTTLHARKSGGVVWKKHCMGGCM